MQEAESGTGHSMAGSAAAGRRASAGRSVVVDLRLRLQRWLRIVLPIVALSAIALVGEAGRRW
jgi:hypothetical protein